MTEPILRLLVLVRFLCFVALVYLGLHVLFSSLISKPESKVLWFFSVLTTPLTRPVRLWVVPSASEARIRFTALVAYGLLWIVIVIVTKIVARTLS